MNLLVTLPNGPIRDSFFEEAQIKALNALGTVQWNPHPRNYTPQELAESLRDVEVAVTGWGTPKITGPVLDAANKLRLLAHTGGTVKPYIGEDAYARGLRATSGNDIFAESVAEGVIGYMLAGLREIARYNNEVKAGHWPDAFYNRGLMYKKVGLVGYGTITRKVVQMLKPFKVGLLVYSRYIDEAELKAHGMRQATLEEIFAQCDVVSLHSAMTDANRHMIKAEHVRRMKPGALLVNTARGGLIDEAGVFPVLNEGKVLAVLDVFEEEPLTDGKSPLCHMDNVTMMPHMAGPTIDRRPVVTGTVIGDIKAFLEGRPMAGEVSVEGMRRMSES